MERHTNPRELNGVRASGAVAIVLGGLVVTLILLYGDSPRPTVDRLNWLLSALVAIAFCVIGHALWRYRRACAVPVDDKFDS